MRSIKASSRACIHPHSRVVSSVCPLLPGLPENIGLNSSKDCCIFLNLVVICSRVSVHAAILFIMDLNSSESSLEIVLVLFVAISHAAVAQFASLSTLIRSLLLLHSAMIRVKFLAVGLFDDMNFFISGMICGPASGVGYPCSSVRWSLCSARVMCFSFRATVSVLSVC